MMNIFRLLGDLSHVLSILVLLLRLRVSKNATGISIKTQELYLLVFITRYLDLFTTFYSPYNTIMKILYIAATAYIVYMVRKTEPFKTTYDNAHDSFLHWQFAALPCAVLAIIANLVQGFNIMEVYITPYLNCFYNIFTLLSLPDALVIFNFLGSLSNRTPTHHSSEISRS